MKIRKLTSNQFFKYSASSFLSSVAEEGVFLLLAWLLAGKLNGVFLALVPMVVARFVSCVINFYINQKLVFQGQWSVWTALVRYFAQAIPVAVLQILGTYGIYELCNIGAEQVALRGIIYAGVMIVLFVVSYILQKIWVFQATEKAKGGKTFESE